MTVSACNLKIRLLHIIHSSSYIINQTTNQHCQMVLVGKHSFARLYPKSNEENAPKTLLFHSWGCFPNMEIGYVINTFGYVQTANLFKPKLPIVIEKGK